MYPYMSKARFPQNWATAELVKQYTRNHRRYEVKKGRMMPRHQRSAATSSGHVSQLPMSILTKKRMTRRTMEMRMREVIPTDQGRRMISSRLYTLDYIHPNYACLLLNLTRCSVEFPLILPSDVHLITY
jgi:hypothetical protein